MPYRANPDPRERQLNDYSLKNLIEGLAVVQNLLAEYSGQAYVPYRPVPGEAMKYTYFLMVICFLSICGCEHEGAVAPSLTLISSSLCKSLPLKAYEGYSSDQDCIHYSWVTGDTLEISHSNAGFNCCPNGFTLKLRVSGDTLVIAEDENSSNCDCNCLFDLNYNLTGVRKNKWWILVDEPYIQLPEQKKILFRADLLKNPEGDYCVTRTGYPWGR